ncbi:uncharacterized protein LOC114184068 [Vigna unguiculata]|uniref:Pyrroline-5-carboxylate reductase n=1 Tax=Vigna unguiculata TaxID=3917 RepID=A0A4D6N763_VIGUN|nr:uncharacterized protein LOC114184068 [Vigna unguiculata]QCE09673.1 hypothetical protein DEO72_LG10g895 [Vigna unguiculata]
MGKVKEQPTSPIKPSSSSSSYVILLLQIMSKRRTWVCVFVLVYGLLFTSSWNILKSMISWYKLQAESSSSSSSCWWPALSASLLLGAVFGVLSMVAAFAVVVPAVLVTWIAIVVLLAFFGKPKRTLVVEGRKITREIFSFVVKVLLKEGNIVAAVCAVLGYFVLGRTNGKGVDSIALD